MTLARPTPPTPATATLFSYTIPWEQPSLLNFLRRGAGLPRIFWENETLTLGFAGIGEAARLTAQGRDRFADIRHQMKTLFAGAVSLGHPAPGIIRPRLFGGFAFTPAPGEGIWAAFPAACFILPRYQLTHFEGKAWLTVHQVSALQVSALQEGALRGKARQGEGQEREKGQVPEEVAWALKEALWELPVPQTAPHHNGYAQRTPLEVHDLMAFATWDHIVSEATRQMRAGLMEKVVLSHSRRAITPTPIEPATILARLRGRYPDCFRFLFEPRPGHAFYGATPELLAEVQDQTLHTSALAGSMPRGDTLEEDLALGECLRHSEKDRREHALVVQAVRDHLAPLVQQIDIPAAPQLYTLSNIHHLLTPISGKLHKDCGVVSVVEALHPTPAVGGMPQKAALRYIQQAEPHSRGWYAAPIGWIDAHGDGMFAVALRSAVSVGGETHMFAGAGIVEASDPEKEWHETGWKFRPILDALQGGRA